MKSKTAVATLLLSLSSCTSGLYMSKIELNTKETIKTIEYRSKGSESPQVAQVTTFICHNVDNQEECTLLSEPILVHGTGLLNDTLANVGSAAVTGGAIAGAAYLYRPDNTNIDNSNKSSLDNDNTLDNSLDNRNNLRNDIKNNVRNTSNVRNNNKPVYNYDPEIELHNTNRQNITDNRKITNNRTIVNKKKRH